MEIQKCPAKKELELICTIVNHGLGSKIIKKAKENAVSGGTVLLGKGTIKNRLLELLDLNDARKEIVLMIADKATASQTLEIFNKDFALYKPNHGIAFTVSVTNLLGYKRYHCEERKEKRGEENTMYQAIFTIVDRGNGATVIEAANKGGARGGTIINARGSGIHETHTLFGMAIEPEKEMILIISKTDQINSIVASISADMHIDEPGKGIIFVLDVNKTYGLYV